MNKSYTFVYFLLLVITGFASYAFYRNSEQLLSFALILFGFLIVDVLIWDWVVKNNPYSFSMKAVFVQAAVFKIFPIISCFSSLINPNAIFPGGESVLLNPLIAGCGLAMASLSVPFAIFVSSIFFQKTGFASLNQLRPLVNNRLETCLIICGGVNVAYWITLLDPTNPLFFLIARVGAGLTFIPFLVGFFSTKMKLSFYIWIGVIAIQLLISYITGTRGKAFLPVGFLLAGVFCGLPSLEKRIRFTVRIGLPIVITLILFGVFVGVARDSVGRTDLFTALRQDSLLNRSAGLNLLEESARKGGIMHSFSRRMTSWPPIVVPTMTPNIVPYRGFGDITEEFESLWSFRIGKSSNLATYYWPNWCLKPYGFAVHMDKRGSMTSSVELSAYVDGFTRGGWAVGFAYLLIAYILLIVAESVARSFLLVHFPEVFLIVLMVVSHPGRFGNSGLLNEARLLLLEGLVCTTIFLGLLFVIRRRP